MTWRREWTVGVVSVAAVALAAVVGAVSLHESCFEPIGGVPDLGTPRAGYCDAVDPTHPWLTLGLLPILVMVGVSVAFRGKVRVVYSIAAILTVALALNAAIVAGMTSHHYI